MQPTPNTLLRFEVRVSSGFEKPQCLLLFSCECAGTNAHAAELDVEVEDGDDRSPLDKCKNIRLELESEALDRVRSWLGLRWEPA